MVSEPAELRQALILTHRRNDLKLGLIDRRLIEKYTNMRDPDPDPDPDHDHTSLWTPPRLKQLLGRIHLRSSSIRRVPIAIPLTDVRTSIKQ